MIIDCHGHFTTAPEGLRRFRQAQLAALETPARSTAPAGPEISDDEVRDAVEAHLLPVMRARGIDVVLLSPQASAMQHHVRDLPTAVAWARVCNDLVHRVTRLFPDHFAGVCQLPQTPDRPVEAAVAELRRCVLDLGFVGCNVNPDPSGGMWACPPITDPAWYPLHEELVDLEVPAMLHVSTSCRAGLDTLGAHYLNADTAVFMQLLGGDLFARFPSLRLIIPHGGGAVPYHWGRYHGLAARMGRPPPDVHLLGNVFFDTCVYHRAGMQLLVDVVGVDHLLFGSEMLGAVRGINPDTGSGWDDTRRYVTALDLTAEQRAALYEGNARRVYPRLGPRLDGAREVV